MELNKIPTAFAEALELLEGYRELNLDPLVEYKIDELLHVWKWFNPVTAEEEIDDLEASNDKYFDKIQDLNDEVEELHDEVEGLYGKLEASRRDYKELVNKFTT